jgi:hypothetical protein
MPLPVDGTALVTGEKTSRNNRNLLQILTLTVAVILSGILWWRFGYKARQRNLDYAWGAQIIQYVYVLEPDDKNVRNLKAERY